MKITTFNPMILTKKPEDAIALFEALGFERHHHKSDKTENEEQGLAFSTVRMKDANGFRTMASESQRLFRRIIHRPVSMLTMFPLPDLSLT